MPFIRESAFPRCTANLPPLPPPVLFTPLLVFSLLSQTVATSAPSPAPTADGLLLLPTSPADGHFQTQANGLARSCRHHCSISDPHSAECWNSSIQFYDQTVLGLLRRTVLAESNRVLWMLDHNLGVVDYAQLANESVRRFTQIPIGQAVEDDNSWRSGHLVFERVSAAIVGEVQSLVRKVLHHYGSNGGLMELPLPKLDCPRGCERSWDLFKWLFVASLLLSLALLATLGLLVLLLDKREQRSWHAESQEFGENARNSKLPIEPRHQKRQMAAMHVLG